PRDASKQLRGVRLTDLAGAEIPFAVTQIETTIRQVLNPHELNLDQWVQRFTIEFIAEDVPACGYKPYRVTPQGSMPSYPAFSPVTETGYEWETFFDDDPYFEDVGDVGDEYLHRKPLNDVRSWHYTGSDNVRPYSRQDNAVRVRKLVTAPLNLPASGDLITRSEERDICPIAVSSTLWHGVPRVEYRVAFDNQATDHRLRIFWQVGQAEHLAAKGAYDVVER